MPVEAIAGARRSNRVPLNVPVVLIDSKTGRPECTGVAMDFSPHGIRFHTSFCCLTPNQTLGMIVMGEPGCFLRCRVVWVAKPGSGRYGEVGFEILSPLQAAA